MSYFDELERLERGELEQKVSDLESEVLILKGTINRMQDSIICARRYLDEMDRFANNAL